MKTRLLLVGALLLAGLVGRAQNPQFSQYFATQLYMNPAFAGNTLQERVSATYRNQWPGLNPGYKSYMVSYDHNFHAANSGLGMMVMRDVAGVGNLSFTKAAAVYSYQVRFTRLHALRWGFEAAYATSQVDFNRFTFGDEYLREGATNTIETFPNQRINYPDFGTGLVFYSVNYWVGASMHHVNRPILSYQGLDSRLPLKYSAHAGFRFVLEDGPKFDPISTLQIVANYKSEQHWDQFDVGAYVKRGPVMAGIWYRGLPGAKSYQRGYGNNDAIVGLVGLEAKNMKFAYSFDLTVSKLSPQSGGAHEISWVYEYAKKSRKRRKVMKVPCPQF